MPGLRRRVAAAIVLPTVAIALAPAAQASPLGTSAAAASASGPTSTAGATAKVAANRFMISAKTTANYKALKARALKLGAKITTDIPELRTVALEAPAAVRASLAADHRTASVGANRTLSIDVEDPLSTPHLNAPGLRSASQVTVPARPAAASSAAAASTTVRADPAFSYPGLQWDYRRIGLPQGWRTTQGSPKVRVGVADTGLDYTHAELKGKVSQVLDFSGGENSYCKQALGVSDEDLAKQYGGPANGDWNGHGSWIGGDIAARLDGQGTNGIAPKVQLVALKISQWCGATDDANILDAFVAAAKMRLDVVSISFGGYLDLTDPQQRVTYYAYQGVVKYARSRGTVIAASAGNEHVRVGAGGRVLSHGQLSTPGDPAANWPDLYGLYEVPGGVPGVVDVAATNRTTVPSSANCPPGTTGTPTATAATCKPTSDAHQAAGQGRNDQLAYYSSYGPRIDIAAPGGARKFNLPFWDRGGTPGFPVHLERPDQRVGGVQHHLELGDGDPLLHLHAGVGLPPGPSATPPSRARRWRRRTSPRPSHSWPVRTPACGTVPLPWSSRLKAHANRSVHNQTRALSATDTSPGDLSGLACAFGYCHLGGARVPDREAYGAGLVNVSRP